MQESRDVNMKFGADSARFKKAITHFICSICTALLIIQGPMSAYASQITDQGSSSVPEVSAVITEASEQTPPVDKLDRVDLDTTSAEAPKDTDSQAVAPSTVHSDADKGYKAIYPDESRHLYVFKVDGKELHHEYVRNGQKVNFYRPPSKEDLVFIGWKLPASELPEGSEEKDSYLDFDKTIQFDPKDPAEERSIELEAVYKKHLAVTFFIPNDEVSNLHQHDSNYIQYDSQKVADGNTVDQEKIGEPSIKNMSFRHWSLTKNGEPFDFNTPITQSINLYAVFAPSAVYYFNSNGGDVIAPRVVDIGKTIAKEDIPVPQKEGYTFVEWREVGSDQAFDFSAPADQDRNLVAFYGAGTTRYSVILHLEKKEEDKDRATSNYRNTYFIQRTGTTGEIPHFDMDAPELNDPSGPYSYTLATPHTSTDARGPFKLSDIFQINEALTKFEEPIKADGTSVYNVYLDYKSIKLYVGNGATVKVSDIVYQLKDAIEGTEGYETFLEILQEKGVDTSAFDKLQDADKKNWIMLGRVYSSSVTGGASFNYPSLVFDAKRTESVANYIKDYKLQLLENIHQAIGTLELTSASVRGVNNVLRKLDKTAQSDIRKKLNENSTEIFTELLKRLVDKHLKVNRVDGYKFVTNGESSYYPIIPTIPEVDFDKGIDWTPEGSINKDSFVIQMEGTFKDSRAVYRYWELPESRGLDYEKDKEKWLPLLKKYAQMEANTDFTQFGANKIAEGEFIVTGGALNADGTDFIDIPKFEVLKELGAYPDHSVHGDDEIVAVKNYDGVYHFNIFYLHKLYQLEFQANLPRGEESAYDLKPRSLEPDEIINEHLPADLVADKTERTVTEADGSKSKLIFRGWYDNPGFAGAPVSLESEAIKMPSANVILYGKWTKPDVTLRIHKTPRPSSEIIFEKSYAYGSHIDDDLIDRLEKFDSGLIPTIPGLNQTGWKELIGKKFINFDPHLVMYRDIDIYPIYDKNFVTVWVRENAGAQKYELADVALGSMYSMPRYEELLELLHKDQSADAPYYFDGWKIVEPKESAVEDRVYLTYDQTEPLFHDITIEPILSEIKPVKTLYTLHDNYEGGQVKEVKPVEHNARINLAEYQPTREGYTLVGWSTAPRYSDGTPYRIDDKVLVDDLESQKANHLYAMWAKVDLQKAVVKVTDANGVERTPMEIKAEGDKVYYRFTVTNVGEVPLSYPKLTDDILSLDAHELSASDLSAGDVSELAVNEKMVYELSKPYVVTSADLALDEIVNKAKIEYETPYGPGTSVEDNSEAKIKVNAVPQIEVRKVIQKITNAQGESYEGTTEAYQLSDRIYYALELKNTGLVPITKVILNDTKLKIFNFEYSFDTPLQVNQTVTLALNNESLGANGILDYHTVVAEDIKLGKVTNVADVIPHTPKRPGEKVETPPVEVVIKANPLAEFSKEIIRITDQDESAYSEEEAYIHKYGDRIYYSFTLKNTGNIPITQAALTDDLLKLNKELADEKGITGKFPILPGESVVFNAPVPYTVAQSDWDKESIVNHAQVNVTFENDAKVTLKDEKSVPLRIEGEPSYHVEKKVEKTTDEYGQLRERGVEAANDKVYYYFEIQNTGNLDISSVSIKDDKLGLDQTYEIAIPVGESATIKSDIEAKLVYTVVTDDFNQDTLVNTATVKVRVPSGDLPPQTPSVEIPVLVNPDFELIKDVKSITNNKDVAYPDTDKVREVEDKIYYTFTLTNTGNVPIVGIKFTDTLLGIDVKLQDVTEEIEGKFPLAPGESLVFNPKDPYLVQEADRSKKVIENTATAKATFSNNAELERSASKEVPIEIKPKLPPTPLIPGDPGQPPLVPEAPHEAPPTQKVDMPKRGGIIPRTGEQSNGLLALGLISLGIGVLAFARRAKQSLRS